MPTPHHPRVESALTRDDVHAGIAYVTYLPEKGVIERGTFIAEPDYDEGDDRWTALAKVQKGAHEIIERHVSLYDAGITPDANGQSWAEAITVADSE